MVRPAMSDDAPRRPWLEVRGICKRFPGVTALDGVGMHVNRGEVVAVIGENGAGKSSLMKILAGVQPADSGQIFLEGRRCQLASVEQALRLGIALIHQELNLADNLEVGANIFLGREPRRFGLLIDKPRILRDSARYLDRVGLKLPPTRLVGSLPIGRKQMVEIAKALSVDARILIMDEPTSSLSQREADQLFEVIRDLSAKGASIVYISHRLGEVKELAHRVVVLRDGKKVGELRRDEIDHENMVQLMVGRQISQFYLHRPHEPGEVVLTADNLRTWAYPHRSCSFALRRGEIVGMFGLVGAGRTELLQTLFGVMPALGGSVWIDGRKTAVRSPIDAVLAGLALVPEDRKQQGLILDLTVRNNLSLTSLRRDQKMGFLNRARERELARDMVRLLKVKATGEGQVTRLLSGGNQQKIALGKWLALHPRILLLDEPTRGIDVGAKTEIYSLMESLAEKGIAVLFVSSEMEEILGMSDRVLVMHEGRIFGELPRAELSEQRVMRLATGQLPEAA